VAQSVTVSDDGTDGLVRVALPDRLEAARQLASLSLRQLSARTGISYSALGKLCAGQRTGEQLQAEQWEALAEALHTELSWISTRRPKHSLHPRRGQRARA